MEKLKQKVSLKRKSDIATTYTGRSSKKKPLLWLVFLFVTIALLIGGYFAFIYNGGKEKAAAAIDGSTTAVNKDATSGTQNTPAKDEILDQAEPEQRAGGTNAAETPVQQEPGKNTQTTNTASAQSIPYQPGKAYKIYQFPFGNADYSQPDPELEELVKVMKSNHSLKISISAYTDNVGSIWYNKNLSTQRAKAIRDYIISKGIDSGRVNFEGKGISTQYPDKAQNRRAEFVITE